MFKWLGKIFASDKAIETGISMIDRGVDMAFYTDEEKAQAIERKETRKDKMIMDWIESRKGSNLSRRFIAILVSCMWAFLFLFSWVSQQAAIWLDKMTAEKLELMKAANESYLDQASGAMMLVLGFYFAAPYMGEIVSNAFKRFAGRKEKPKEE